MGRALARGSSLSVLGLLLGLRCEARQPAAREAFALLGRASIARILLVSGSSIEMAGPGFHSGVSRASPDVDAFLAFWVYRTHRNDPAVSVDCRGCIDSCV